MKKRISLLHAIEINTSAEKIFDFVSDLSNDVKWRPEVERMETKGERKIGTIVIEYIRIYKFFKIITPTEIKVLDRPHKFTVETPASHPTWVECIRSIEKVGNDTVRFTVRLSFSLDNLKQVFPFTPPSFAVRWWYAPRMKKYLKNLKNRLET
jgi:hypothetical protein